MRATMRGGGRFSGFASALIVVAASLPGSTRAQSWELDVGIAAIDHDPPSWVSEGGEQLPTGLGVAARFVFPDDHWFVDLAGSRGGETRPASVCHGFVEPGSCVLEPVEHVGSSLLLTAGWLSRHQVGSMLRVGLRPRAGMGFVHAFERGLDTGREYTETKFAGTAGVSCEVALRVRPGWWLSLAVGGDLLWPRSVRCDDCAELLNSLLPKASISAGVSWSPSR